MTANIRFDMLEASNPRQAAIQSVKHAVTTILKIESLTARDTEDEAHLAEAKSNLFAGIRELRVLDVAPFIKSLIENSKDEDLRSNILVLEDRIDDADSTLNEKVVDTLALANIYEHVDEKKSRLLNANAYFNLGTGQHNKIDRIIGTLEHIQMYYSDAEDEREAAGEFTLSPTQMQDLDRILVAKTNDFLSGSTHDADLADRLAYLLESHKDKAVSSVMLQKLFDVRTDAGRAEYIETLLNHASEDNAEDDDIVTNPILARAGLTYGELFAKFGALETERERLNTPQQSPTALIIA